jgi:hypothetical protein
VGKTTVQGRLGLAKVLFCLRHPALYVFGGKGRVTVTYFGFLVLDGQHGFGTHFFKQVFLGKSRITPSSRRNTANALP